MKRSIIEMPTGIDFHVPVIKALPVRYSSAHRQRQGPALPKRGSRVAPKNSPLVQRLFRTLRAGDSRPLMSRTVVDCSTQKVERTQAARHKTELVWRSTDRSRTRPRRQERVLSMKAGSECAE
jgi:hypothetical protein